MDIEWLLLLLCIPVVKVPTLHLQLSGYLLYPKNKWKFTPKGPPARNVFSCTLFGWSLL